MRMRMRRSPPLNPVPPARPVAAASGGGRTGLSRDLLLFRSKHHSHDNFIPLKLGDQDIKLHF